LIDTVTVTYPKLVVILHNSVASIDENNIQYQFLALIRSLLTVHRRVLKAVLSPASCGKCQLLNRPVATAALRNRYRAGDSR